MYATRETFPAKQIKIGKGLVFFIRINWSKISLSFYLREFHNAHEAMAAFDDSSWEEEV